MVSGIAFLFLWGISGVQIANLLAYATGAVLNTLSVFELTGKNIGLIKKSGVMLLLGGIILLPTALASELTAPAVLGIAALSGVVYLVLVAMLPLFSKSELLSVPLGNKLERLTSKIGIKRDD